MTACAGNPQVCMNHACERHQLFAITIAGDEFGPHRDAVVLKNDGDVREAVTDAFVAFSTDCSDTTSLALARKGNASAIARRAAGVFPGSQHGFCNDMFDIACGDQDWPAGAECRIRHPVRRAAFQFPFAETA